MPRNGYTQTRTFIWNGIDLVSAQNPENGTLSYSYDSNHRVTSRLDAKGQKTDYAYDGYGRLLSRRYWYAQQNQSFGITYESWPEEWYENLSDLWVWFTSSTSGTSANSCKLRLDVSTSQLNLLNDAGTGWTSGAFGSGTLQNSQCRVDLASSWYSLGSYPYLYLNVTFLAYQPAKQIWKRATGTLTQNWEQQGTWNYVEQTNKRVDFGYDGSGYYNGGSGATAWGRLTSVIFGDGLGSTFRYDYLYNAAGKVLAHRMSRPFAFSGYGYGHTPPDMEVQAMYYWDTEGRMTQASYPSVSVPQLPTGQGANIVKTYDDTGRLYETQRWDAATYQWTTVERATYGPAGQLATLWTAAAGTETRQYNSLLQLTRATVPGKMDMEYRFTAGMNNGRIAQSKDWISGEEVTYAYDSLQRLIAAETTGPEWGQSYSYDGFGNLTNQTVTKGMAPSLSLAYDPATNRPYGVNFDANGNQAVGTWDAENRLVAQTLDGQAVQWVYDPFGKRVMRYQETSTGPGSAVRRWQVYFNGITGERLVQFKLRQDYMTRTHGVACGLRVRK